MVHKKTIFIYFIKALAMANKIIYSIYFFFISYISIGQISLSSLLSAKLGTPYQQDIALRKKTIKGQYLLMRSKEDNEYKLEFENIAIDNYGNADLTFTYLKEILASVDIYFRSECRSYRSLVQNYKEIDLVLKNTYKALIDKVGYGYDYELWNKNIPDSAQKVFTSFQKDKLRSNPNNNFGVDTYLLNQKIFTDKRSVMLSVSMYASVQNIGRSIMDTTCQQYLGLGIYNSKTMELIRTYNSTSKTYEILERQDNIINLRNENGVFYLKAKLNGELDNQEFIFDTGASDVTITPDVFSLLYKSGSIKDSDLIGTATYKLADGSTIKTQKLILREIKIGQIILNDVEVSVSNNIAAPMLFGQSAISKLGNYKIDINQGVLILVH